MHLTSQLRQKVAYLWDAAGINVLYDDREKERLGVKLSDMDLIGIPHRVIVGEKGIDKGSVEYKHRRDSDNQDIAIDDLIDFLLKLNQ